MRYSYELSLLTNLSYEYYYYALLLSLPWDIDLAPRVLLDGIREGLLDKVY